jgi:hypothetical protein
MRSLTSVVLAICVVGASVPARAGDPAQEQASALNDQGNAAFDLGNYDEAIDKFTDAYKAYPDARILYNLAQSYRKKKDYERALQVYQNYIRNLPSSTNRKTVEDLIVELQGLIARQKAASDRPPQGTTSTTPQVPPVVTKIEEPRPWYANSSGWWLVGGGAIAAGVGIGFFISTGSLRDQLVTAPDPEKAGIRSDISTRNTVGTVLTVVGGLAVAGGVVIFLVSPRMVTREIVPIKDLKLSVAPNWIGVAGRF